MKKFLLFLLIAVVYVLHQDNWNWTNKDLILASCRWGFGLPRRIFRAGGHHDGHPG